jgi:serine/threonine-protein kinase
MAEVWQAHDQTLDRDVAIKLLHAHLAADPDFVERFRREAVAVARLSHPNVVTVYDTGVEPSPTDHGVRAFIVMELLRGDSLRALLNRPDPAQRPTVAEAVRIAAESADGLAYAHRNGVVHRDVKPGNIIVETLAGEQGRGRFGRVRVVDFGIAKQAAADRTGEDLTRAGSILGTAKYVAPEQVEGFDVDARSDIYSLGVVLYEMVCGRVPFQGPNDLATAMQHVRAAVPAPRTVRPGIARSLDAAILRALAKDPAQRYATAEELAATLRSLDLRPDDATPHVTRTPSDRTPPHGTPIPDRPPNRGADATTVRGPADRDRPRPPEPERRLLKLLLVLVGLAAGALAGITLADDRADRLTSLDVLRAQSFELDPDPAGEHDLELPRLFDADPATTWSTETWGSRSFNGRKSGVGVVLILADTAEIKALDLITPTLGWAAKIYVSDELASDLDGWGEPVGQIVASPIGHERIKLRPSIGSYVLLWITDLGPKVGPVAQVKIGEASVWG